MRAGHRFTLNASAIVCTAVSGSSGSIPCTVARTAPSAAAGVALRTSSVTCGTCSCVIGCAWYRNGCGSSPMKLYLLSPATPTTSVERGLPEEAEALADRLFVGPEARRHRLVDDDDPRRLGGSVAANPRPRRRPMPVVAK